MCCQDGSSRSNKARVYTAGALHDVQMRPAANSLMFTANKLSKPQPQLPLAPVQQSEYPPPRPAPPPSRPTLIRSLVLCLQMY